MLTSNKTIISDCDQYKKIKEAGSSFFQFVAQTIVKNECNLFIVPQVNFLGKKSCEIFTISVFEYNLFILHRVKCRRVYFDQILWSLYRISWSE